MRIRRRGVTVFEVSIAVVLLAVVTVTLVQLAHAIERHRRATECRETAIREANNVLERLLIRPWNELASPAEPLTISAAARELLREPDLRVEVATPPTDPDAKRVQVSLDWRDAVGNRVVPVRLTGWKFRPAEAAP